MYTDILKVGFISGVTIGTVVTYQKKRDAFVAESLKDHPFLMLRGELTRKICAFVEKAQILESSGTFPLREVESLIKKNQNQNLEGKEAKNAITEYRELAKEYKKKNGHYPDEKEFNVRKEEIRSTFFPNAVMLSSCALSHLLMFHQPIFDSLLNRQYFKIFTAAISTSTFIYLSFKLHDPIHKKMGGCKGIILPNNAEPKSPFLCSISLILYPAAIATNIAICKIFISNLSRFPLTK